jgi:hypothetical protein
MEMRWAEMPRISLVEQGEAMRSSGVATKGVEKQWIG